MKELWRNVLRRVRSAERWLDTRELRERVILGVGALAVGAALWSVLVMDPATARRRTLEGVATSLEGELAALDVQAAEIRAAHEVDPNAELRDRIGALSEQIEALDESIHAHTVAMVSPAEMARFLEDLLEQHVDLRLVRVENLGAEPLLGELAASADPDDSRDPGAAAALEVTGGVYKHAFEVELEGGYLSTLAYLEALEALPWGFFWEALAYEVEEYPKGRAVLRAYTLSSEEEWIGV